MLRDKRTKDKNGGKKSSAILDKGFWRVINLWTKPELQTNGVLTSVTPTQYFLVFIQIRDIIGSDSGIRTFELGIAICVT